MKLKQLVGASAVFLAASTASFAQQPGALSTRSGLEIGAQLSHYEYTEPNVAELKGNRLGLVAAGTVGGNGGLFGKIDGRLSHGSLDYKGSGTMSGVPDLIFEIRAVAGIDLVGQGVGVSPYVGLGYRYLYNDLNGRTSTNAAGYRRYSNYLYVPVGATLRFSLSSDWVLAPTAEYDFFIQGKQKSMLSDASPAFNDVTNTQNSGKGYRFYVMFEKDRLSVGPWMHYWHIDKSDVQPIGGGQAGLEPENTTREFGLELRYRF